MSALFVLLAVAAPALAQDSDVPYWASIRAEVVRREEGWRLVEDPDGTQGWVLAQFLSRDRTAIVTGKGLAEMRKEADGKTPLLWRLRPGVVARLRSCESGWCNVEMKGHKGFVRQGSLWGGGDP